MKQVLICVKDTKAEVYASPFAFRNENEAMRAYGEAIPKDPMLSKYPGDFELYQIARWDNETGELVVESKKICSVADLVIPGSASEVSGVKAGTFPVQETSAESDQVASQEEPVCEQKRRIYLGGDKE